MDEDSRPDETTSEKNVSEGEAFTSAVCPLSIRQQHWNLVRYAVHMSLIYFAAPVIYVGNLDAVLLNKLGYSDTVANLPFSAYWWTTAPFLVLFTWYFCQVRMLKPVLVASYAMSAAAGLIVVVSLLQPPSYWLVASLVMHAMLMSWCLGIINVFEWEILARGVAEQRRGLALSLAFGFGPVMAVLSSLGTQLVLDGSLGPIHVGKLPFPWDFLALFAASVLIMAVPAVSSTRYIIPIPPTEVAREPLVAGVFGGLGGFLKNRLLMLAAFAMLLMVLGGSSILPNVVLYTKEALGAEPQQYAGYQFALRFAFKAATGFLLGWMLVRTHPRAGLAATTCLCLSGLLWALMVPGKWYLVSFGLLGAGELYYVYYQNYLVSCSPKSMVRRNLAYASLLVWSVSLAPVIFGIISDNFGQRCSIEIAATILFGTLLLVQFALPRQPSI
ncbi:MAG: MFS transporter [Pirellulales bacterium]|nr:MFS transporter [Pirellulales bacterium]